MRTSTAETDDRAAAMARHPAARLRATPHGRRPTTSGACSFAALVAQLTGPWRAHDPHGFAAAMLAAPLVGGHPVLDLAVLDGPTPGAGGGDPWSDGAGARLRAAVAGAAVRIEPRALAGERPGAGGGRHLFVEGPGQAPASGAGPEIFVVAHLVEWLGPGGERTRGRAGHSWALMVVGDGTGGIAGVLRAVLACPEGCCSPPPSWARLPLAALRERLVAAAPGVVASGAVEPGRATVIPLRRGRDLIRGRESAPPMLAARASAGRPSDKDRMST